MLNSRILRALLALFVAMASSLALAHPKLLSSTPGDKSEVATPASIELDFSERLLPEFSAANLLMTDMPGMAMHGATRMAFTVTGGADGKTMVIKPAQPLPVGTYRVEWRAVSADTHRVTGTFTFQVK